MCAFRSPGSPSDLGIESATDVVARERAGRRDTRNASRSQNYRAVDDRPCRYEAILLAPGENKIDVEIDTRMPNAAIFTFHKEDHTLGNLLCSRLHEHPHVLFSAYKVPHPLTPNFLLRVQTDGALTPRKAVIEVAQKAIQDLDILSRNFTREYELAKMRNAANQPQAQD